MKQTSGIDLMSFDPRNITQENATTSFTDDECIIASNVGPRQSALRLQLDWTQFYRKVYLFLEATLSVDGADFQVEGAIEFRRNGQVLARLPASIARDATASALAKSLACISVGASAPVADSLRVCLSKKFTGGYDNVALTPARICVHADEAIIHIERCRVVSGTITGLRFYAAVMSSSNPI